MDKKRISQLLDAIPDDLDFEAMVNELLKQPGVSQTTLGNFAHSSKSAISRIGKGQTPYFQTGLGLLRMYVTLCPDTSNHNDEKGKDNA